MRSPFPTFHLQVTLLISDSDMWAGFEEKKIGHQFLNMTVVQSFEIKPVVCG